MNGTRNVIEANARIPAAPGREMLRRLGELDPAFLGVTDFEGFQAATRWYWYEHKDTGDWDLWFAVPDAPSTGEEKQIIEVGDLFAPDSYLVWEGDDGATWGWLMNHRARAFSEVTATVIRDVPVPKTHQSAVECGPIESPFMVSSGIEL
jgi:hypothetical protein